MIRRIFLGIFVALFFITSTGCFGTFSLTRKVYQFNEDIGDKWIQSVTMWVMLVVPVYAVCGFIDVVFCNVLEFWTGSNPVAIMNDEIIEQTVEKNGVTYNVRIGKGAIIVSEENGRQSGKTMSLKFDKKRSRCTLSNGDESRTICLFHPKPLNLVDVYYPDGSIKTFNTRQCNELALSQ